jgi:hypothetical protein
MSEVIDYDEEAVDPRISDDEVSGTESKPEDLFTETAKASIRETGILFSYPSARYAAAEEKYKLIKTGAYVVPPEKINRTEALEEISESDHKYYDWCETREDFELQTAQLDRERHDRELIGRHPIQAFIASAGVGLLEFPFFPGIAGNISKAVSSGLTATAKTGLKEGLKYSAVSSAIRLPSHDLMTAEEAAYETVAGGILGSCFGVGTLGISKALRSKYVKALAEKLGTGFEESFFKFGKEKNPESTKEIVFKSDGTKSEYTYADMHPFVQKIIRNNPITQGLGSDSEVLQMFTDVTYRHNFLTKARKKGDYVGVVSAEAGKEVRDAIFYDMVDRYYGKSEEFIKAHPEYSLKDFNLFVTRNIKEGQVSADRHISEASKIYTDWINKETDDAVKFKYFDKDPRIKSNIYDKTRLLENKSSGEEAVNYNPVLEYFTTVYDREKISQNETEFIKKIRLKLLRDNPEYSEEELRKISYSILDNITGNDLEKYALPFRSKEGNVKITKQRKFLISYGDFQDFEEFLVNDPIEVGNLLRRYFSPGIELARVGAEIFSKDSPIAGELEGKTVIGKWLTVLEKERNIKSEAAVDDKTKELIRSKYKKYAELISDGELLLRGIYGAPTCSVSLTAAKLADGLKMWNYMRQLGGVCLTAIVDNKNTVNRFGFGRSCAALLKSFSKDSAFRLNKSDLRKWGAADETARLSLYNKYLEQSDLSVYRTGKVMNLTGKASNIFSKANLLNYCNDYNKRIVATLHGTDIAEACTKYNLSAKDAQFLAQARIPLHMRKEIAKRFGENGYFDENGLAVFGLDKWEDDEVTRTFAASLTAAANQTIIIPSAGDTPRVFKKTWGKLLFQYKSYQFAMMNNVIAPWFNGQNSHASAAVATGIGLGYLSAYLSSLTSGDPYLHPDDPNFHAKAAERSDLFGYFSDAVSFFGRALNADRSFGETTERLSPSISLISDIWYLKNEAIKSYVREDYRAKERNLRTIKGLLPFNNLFYYNGFINNMLRTKAERDDMKLLKTEEDRYMEGK